MTDLTSIDWTDLESTNLILRAPRDSDAPGIFGLYRDEASSLLDDWEPMTCQAEAERKIVRMRDAFREKDTIAWVVADRSTGAVIGCAGLFGFDPDNANCCLFYIIAPAWRGRGLATEAIRLMTGYGLDKLRLHRMYAYITPGNAASIRALEKNGYRQEGLLRDMEFYKGRYWDGLVMAILDSDPRPDRQGGQQ
jgi:ribosomal-protein-alanine N-acetyltransferase